MKEFVVVSELDYSLVVHRLLGETQFWARDALLCLLQNTVFPSRYACRLMSGHKATHSQYFNVLYYNNVRGYVEVKICG